MEAIKKILNPGKEREDKVLYGSGEDPLLTGTQSSQTHGQDSQVGGRDITETDPRSPATNPAVSSDYEIGKGRPLGTSEPSGLAGNADQYPSSGPRGGVDETSTTASILSGIPGKDQPSSLTRPSGTNDALDVNKPLPPKPTGTGFTDPETSSAQPHAATVGDNVDPYAGANYDRSRGIGPEYTTGSGLTGNALPDRTLGSSEYDTQPQPTDSSFGRDAALGAGVGAGVGAGTAAALHHKRDEDNLRSASGRSTDNADTSTAGPGLSGVTGGASAGPHSSSLANKADPRVDSDLDGSGTAGPHSSSLANKADPRVDSDLDGSRTVGSAGYPSGIGSTTGAIPPSVSEQDGRTGAGSGIGNLPTGQTAAGGYGPESWKHEHVSCGHEFAGDPCHDGSVEGRPLFTKGPHVTDTANLLDPHVTPQVRLASESTAISSDKEPGLNTQIGDAHRREVPGLGSTTYGDDRQGREVSELGSTTHPDSYRGGEATASESIGQKDKHHGRDAALVGGLGAAGAGAAYSSSRDDAPPAEDTSTTTGPHRSKLLNKLDPRVHNSSTGSERPTSTTETSALIGSSDPGSTSHMPTSKEVGTSHDHGREVGVGLGAAGLAGAAGAAGYESERRPTNLESTTQPTSTTGVGSNDTAEASTKGSYGDNVTSAVDRGLGFREKEQYPRDDKGQDRTSRLPDAPDGHYPQSQEPTDLKGNATTVPSAAKDPTSNVPESDPGHHLLRDAGLASAGIGGGLAAYEVQKAQTRDEPVTTSTDPSTYPPSGQEAGGRIADPYAERDSAPASGGVGTGLGTDDGGEVSNREAEKLAEARNKEFEKEQKAIHKEQVKHEKALEKEEKKHEKEERKHEKAVEKEEKRLQKEEKKHEKELAKEEKESHDDGKKHGGILGLFHRDKSDKADETDVRDEYPEGSYQEPEATGLAAAGDGTGVGTGDEPEKHKPNKLHKDPPAGYYESKGYYPPTTGDGSQPSDVNDQSSGYQRSATGDVYPKVPGGTIIDPQTGLPVDLEKGTGAGGTDNGTMPGYHPREADASGHDRSRDINQL